MSNYYYLYCDQTNECIEVVAEVGCKPSPRIQANALQAFLTYHHIKAPGAALTMCQLDRISVDRNIVESLEDAAEDFESIGGFPQYKPPVMIWTENNFRALASRMDGLAAQLEDFEQAPSGGVWVRRTQEGRTIEGPGKQSRVVSP